MGPVKSEDKMNPIEHRQRVKEKKKSKEKKLLSKLNKLKNKEKARDDSKNTIKYDVSTLSIAVPASILENAQSSELRSYLVGQISRAACIYKVDEIVVFDDLGVRNMAGMNKKEVLDSEGNPVRRSCLQFARILQYLECPQYLRKYFFPIHEDLQHAGLLNPLDAPHHLRQDDEFPFREGVIMNMPTSPGKGSVVNCGLRRNVTVDKLLEPNMRVTVKLNPQREGVKKLRGVIVPPSQPCAETGTYWGYNVRIARSLEAIFSKSPYPEGYDLSIGTSEKGETVDEIPLKGLPEHHHAIVVFGGLQGLEAALENDEVLAVENPALLFDHYLNTCPSQGSRIIRTEEAIFITLAELRTKLNPKFLYTKEENINSEK